MGTRRHWFTTAALGLVLTLAACGSGPPTVRMTTNPSIPGAQGTVKYSVTDNGNTAIELEVRHLAPPEQVEPGATTYVAWARAPGQDTPQNLGALRVDEDLRGTLETVTPMQSFDLYITAESSPTASAPTNRELLTASIQR